MRYSVYKPPWGHLGQTSHCQRQIWPLVHVWAALPASEALPLLLDRQGWPACSPGAMNKTQWTLEPLKLHPQLHPQKVPLPEKASSIYVGDRKCACDSLSSL